MVYAQPWMFTGFGDETAEYADIIKIKVTTKCFRNGCTKCLAEDYFLFEGNC